MFKAFKPLMLVRDTFCCVFWGGRRVVSLLAKCSGSTDHETGDVYQARMRSWGRRGSDRLR